VRRQSQGDVGVQVLGDLSGDRHVGRATILRRSSPAN
jgi:hypothetical protein